MIDARNIFRKVNNRINDFSEEQLSGLTTLIKSFRDEKVDFSKNDWVKKFFNKGKYEDVEGLCKIVTNEELIKNDYSLTPGRYVGYKLIFEKNLDYKKEIIELNKKIEKLTTESSELTKKLHKINFND
jgi:type I restriction enzyme M protein